MTDNLLRCRPPAGCSDEELRWFEARVREGFAGSDEGLPGRVRAAALLAFCGPAGVQPTAIAGLKAPSDAYRTAVFDQAAAGAADFPFELGWIYVVPERRGKGTATTLCRELLARAPGEGVFATTRPDNRPMIHILVALGFAPAGHPYTHVRRDELMRLFLRPSADSPARPAHPMQGRL